MSNLIVEMEMPKRCINCGVRLKCKRYVCGLRQDIAEDLNPLMGDKDCLIKGVLPDEHGDLIDRDIMYKEIELWKSTATDTITLCFLYHIERLLMSIRPIIATERKGDEQIH